MKAKVKTVRCDSDHLVVVDTAWNPSDFRLTPVRTKGDDYPAAGHHLGRSPKHYRRSKTGRMISDYPELDFRAADNSGMRAGEVPAGTRDIGVFRCAQCGRPFESIIANRVRQLRDGRPANRCAQCSGWTPTAGNTLADLPTWLRCQLRVPPGTDLASMPLKGGTERRFVWECPAGHRFRDRVLNRIRDHAGCNTDEAHTCGCKACAGLRATPERNFASEHPALAARLDRLASRNGYASATVAPQGGKAKHWFWCGDEAHAPYYSLASNALKARGLGCHGCATLEHRNLPLAERSKRSRKAYGRSYQKRGLRS